MNTTCPVVNSAETSRIKKYEYLINNKKRNTKLQELKFTIGMNIKDLRKKTAGELDKELGEKAVALSNFRFGTSGSKTKNVKAGRNLKKEIAQILTILNESKKEKKA